MIGMKKQGSALLQRSENCQQWTYDVFQRSLVKAVRETVALLLFFGLGGRRKLLNLAAEQEVNPFCLSLKEKKNKTKLKEESNKDKMYKLNYAQDLGSKQNERKRDKDVL